MYKILPLIFLIYTRVWYHNHESDFIIDLHDLYVKIISYFNTIKPAKNVGLSSLALHNMKMRTSEHISKGLTMKCSTWRIYSNLLPIKS
jgi:hypothetical protein